MAPPATTGRRAWIGLAVLALPTLLLSLDMSVLYLALPALSADLGLGPTAQLWAMDVYGFMIAGFLVTMGTLGDRIGRRRLLLIGAAAFGVASVIAAFSNGPAMLIASRALLGVAGATLMPSTLGLIRTMFPDPRARGTAIAIWMSCFMGGMTIGPLIGGVLLEAFWWGAAFLMGVPVMALLLVLGPVLLPESRDTGAGRLDLVSVALSLGAVLSVVHGLKSLAADGAGAGALTSLAVGLVVGALFVRRQLRLDDPLLDLRLFRHRAPAGVLAIGLGGGVVMAGTFLLLTLYLQLVAGLSVLTVGLVLAPLQAAMVVASLLAPRLAQSIRPARVMAGGLLIGAVGLAVVGLLGAGEGGGTVVLLGGFLLASVGIALPTALGTDLLVGSVPEEKAGSAGALSETSGELGIALGVATLGSLATAVYRDDLVVPPGTPAPLATPPARASPRRSPRARPPSCSTRWGRRSPPASGGPPPAGRWCSPVWRGSPWSRSVRCRSPRRRRSSPRPVRGPPRPGKPPSSRRRPERGAVGSAAYGAPHAGHRVAAERHRPEPVPVSPAARGLRRGRPVLRGVRAGDRGLRALGDLHGRAGRGARGGRGDAADEGAAAGRSAPGSGALSRADQPDGPAEATVSHRRDRASRWTQELVDIDGVLRHQLLFELACPAVHPGQGLPSVVGEPEQLAPPVRRRLRARDESAVLEPPAHVRHGGAVERDGVGQ